MEENRRKRWKKEENVNTGENKVKTVKKGEKG